MMVEIYCAKCGNSMGKVDKLEFVACLIGVVWAEVCMDCDPLPADDVSPILRRSYEAGWLYVDGTGLEFVGKKCYAHDMQASEVGSAGARGLSSSTYLHKIPVLIYADCPDCDGSGRVMVGNIGPLACVICGGSGKVRESLESSAREIWIPDWLLQPGQGQPGNVGEDDINESWTEYERIAHRYTEFDRNRFGVADGE